jgi:hypothetical protein
MNQLLYTTIRITTINNDNTIGAGTGFFFNFNTPIGSVPTIITNKHVVEKAITGQFRVHLSRQEGETIVPNGKPEDITIDDFKNLFYQHPDPAIDLCAMFFQPIFEEMEKRGKTIFYKLLDESFLPTQEELEEMGPVEEITMVGYPNGLWDSVNNYPLFRRGFTASHPAINYEGKSITVIDAACFPGSSGSPVIQIDHAGIHRMSTGNFSLGGRSNKLLGVLFEGPLVTTQGEIVIRQVPTVAIPIPVTQMMMHLGHIVKAREIAVLGDSIRVAVKEREDKGEQQKSYP